MQQLSIEELIAQKAKEAVSEKITTVVQLAHQNNLILRRVVEELGVDVNEVLAGYVAPTPPLPPEGPKKLAKKRTETYKKGLAFARELVPVDSWIARRLKRDLIKFYGGSPTALVNDAKRKGIEGLKSYQSVKRTICGIGETQRRTVEAFNQLLHWRLSAKKLTQDLEEHQKVCAPQNGKK